MVSYYHVYVVVTKFMLLILFFSLKYSPRKENTCIYKGASIMQYIRMGEFLGDTPFISLVMS